MGLREYQNKKNKKKREKNAKSIAFNIWLNINPNMTKSNNLMEPVHNLLSHRVDRISTPSRYEKYSSKETPHAT